MAEETVELHNCTVLMASGDTDEWVDIKDAVMEVDLGGALMIVGSDDKVAAIYAPGMWMKVEYDQ
jgi:hypothetical protein